MNKHFSFSVFSFLAIIFSHSLYAAPGIDVTVKVGQWQTDYSGDIGQGADIATLEELGFDDESQNTWSVTIDHALPVLPNIKIQNTT